MSRRIARALISLTAAVTAVLGLTAAPSHASGPLIYCGGGNGDFIIDSQPLHDPLDGSYMGTTWQIYAPTGCRGVRTGIWLQGSWIASHPETNVTVGVVEIDSSGPNDFGLYTVNSSNLAAVNQGVGNRWFYAIDDAPYPKQFRSMVQVDYGNAEASELGAYHDYSTGATWGGVSYEFN